MEANWLQMSARRVREETKRYDILGLQDIFSFHFISFVCKVKPTSLLHDTGLSRMRASIEPVVADEGPEMRGRGQSDMIF